MPDGQQRIADAISSAEQTAICAYITAGYPTLGGFESVLKSTLAAADVVEVGVPFTDPMADGMTIQHASHVALENGVNLEWILSVLSSTLEGEATPVLLMGYYNPFLAYGLDRLGAAMADAGVSGLIVPDLPLDEAGDMLEALGPHGVALVQLVTPSTPDERLEKLARASQGFVYAVTTTGVTGGTTELAQEALDYLDRVEAASELPVLAGFGIRNASQVTALSPHVEGVVVGSALVDAVSEGRDPGEFISSLRGEGVPA